MGVEWLAIVRSVLAKGAKYSGARRWLCRRGCQVSFIQLLRDEPNVLLGVTFAFPTVQDPSGNGECDA